MLRDYRMCRLFVCVYQLIECLSWLLEVGFFSTLGFEGRNYELVASRYRQLLTSFRRKFLLRMSTFLQVYSTFVQVSCLVAAS